MVQACKYGRKHWASITGASAKDIVTDIQIKKQIRDYFLTREHGK